MLVVYVENKILVVYANHKILHVHAEHKILAEHTEHKTLENYNLFYTGAVRNITMYIQGVPVRTPRL